MLTVLFKLAPTSCNALATLFLFLQKTCQEPFLRSSSQQHFPVIMIPFLPCFRICFFTYPEFVSSSSSTVQSRGFCQHFIQHFRCIVTSGERIHLQISHFIEHQLCCDGRCVGVFGKCLTQNIQSKISNSGPIGIIFHNQVHCRCWRRNR